MQKHAKIRIRKFITKTEKFYRYKIFLAFLIKTIIIIEILLSSHLKCRYVRYVVEMSSEEDAQAVIEQLNGEDLDGRNIVV